MPLIEYPSSDVCLLYLLRHGATGPNLANPPVIQGSGIDEPLAEIGVQQAKCAAAELAERPIQKVYASPLVRAMQTAQQIATAHGLAPEAAHALIEAQVGSWEGKSWDEIQREDPENYQAFRDDPGKHGYPQGETLTELSDRVTPCFEGLMRQHVGEEIVVVAHSVVNRVYLAQVLGLGMADGYQIEQLNCAINVVRWKRDRAKIVTINAIHHLMA